MIIPEELKEVLASDARLSEIFDGMTLTYQREYAEYIEDASRLKKIIPMIMSGVSLNDKYR